MSEKKPLSNGAILLGLVLIIAGTLALLDNLNLFSFRFNLGDWWPLILVALGVVHLWNNRTIFDFSGLFLILLGVVFLLAELGRICWGDVWRWWPAVLILLGISIVFKRGSLPLPGERPQRHGQQRGQPARQQHPGRLRPPHHQPRVQGRRHRQHPGRHRDRPAGSQAGAGRMAAHGVHRAGRRRDPPAARLAPRGPADHHAGRHRRPHAAEPRRHGRQADHQGLGAAGRHRDQELKQQLSVIRERT